MNHHQLQQPIQTVSQWHLDNQLIAIIVRSELTQNFQQQHTIQVQSGAALLFLVLMQFFCWNPKQVYDQVLGTYLKKLCSGSLKPV
jgi:hypothetical protein